MKKDKEALSALEKLAQETKEHAKILDQIDKSLLRPYSIQRLGLSFAEEYPALSEIAALKDALKTEPFQFGGEKLKEAFERLCEPFASTQALIDSYNLGSDSLVRSSFSELLDTERYRIPEGAISALESSMIPVLKNIPTSEMIDGMSSTLLAFSANLDSSWLHTDTSWAVQAAKILQVEMEGIDKTGISSLLALEQETSRMMLDSDVLTSVSAQMASISKGLDGLAEHWKEIVAPLPMLEDLQALAAQQHKIMQRAGEISEWRLGLLDCASRLVDRQVTWSEGFISEVQDKIDDTNAEEQADEQSSPVSLLPQYLGYANRGNVSLTTEEAFEKSVLVEITEKGKKIMDNIVRLNDLQVYNGQKEIFSCTNKLVKVATYMGSLVCTSEDDFGKMIDGVYFLFYENLNHIKTLDSDDAVRKEEVYQCIFRVKDIRTDLRHDYEHGKNSDINKKRNDISESYKHYTNKPVLRKQRDYVTLQRKLYDELLVLEDHLFDLIERTTMLSS